MKIIQVNNNKFIDQDLFDYINKIWLNYDIEIDKGSNIYFSKNTTINRLITDYTGKDISRVIKKEKADYMVLKRIVIQNYPQYYDPTTSSTTSDDTKEVVYGIYNNSIEDQDCIQLILWFYENQPEVKYLNQDKLNDSLNNGFIIDKDSYVTLKELIDSTFTDNHILACNMLIQSELKSNWEWILYLYFQKGSLLTTHDKKNIVINYISSLGLPYRFDQLNSNVDTALEVITNPDVKIRFEYLMKDKFRKGIEAYIKTLGTNKFILEDFKLKYNE